MKIKGTLGLYHLREQIGKGMYGRVYKAVLQPPNLSIELQKNFELIFDLYEKEQFVNRIPIAQQKMKDEEQFNFPFANYLTDSNKKLLHELMKVELKYYAVKVIKKSYLSKEVESNLQEEINLLKQLNTPYVIKLYEVIEREQILYLITEYCNGGDLQNMVEINQNIHNEHVVRSIIAQVVQGLYYMNEQNIAHRDLKLANIFIHFPKIHSKLQIMQTILDQKTLQQEEYIIKIGDLGFASKNKDGTFKSFCGTPLNMAPEILLKQSYNFKADIWSLGVCLYELLVGTTPFTDLNKRDLIISVQKGEIRIPKNLNVSLICLQFLNQCMQFDQEQRISIQELICHPFLQQELEIRRLSSQLSQIQEKIFISRQSSSSLPQVKDLQQLYYQCAEKYIPDFVIQNSFFFNKEVDNDEKDIRYLLMNCKSKHLFEIDSTSNFDECDLDEHSDEEISMPEFSSNEDNPLLYMKGSAKNDIKQTTVQKTHDDDGDTNPFQDLKSVHHRGSERNIVQSQNNFIEARFSSQMMLNIRSTLQPSECELNPNFKSSFFRLKNQQHVTLKNETTCDHSKQDGSVKTGSFIDYFMKAVSNPNSFINYDNTGIDSPMLEQDQTIFKRVMNYKTQMMEDKIEKIEEESKQKEQSSGSNSESVNAPNQISSSQEKLEESKIRPQLSFNPDLQPDYYSSKQPSQFGVGDSFTNKKDSQMPFNLVGDTNIFNQSITEQRN